MINVYVDGSFRPETKEGFYGLLIRERGQFRKVGGSLGKIRDSNVAEYGAILKGLEEVKMMGLAHEPVKIYTDSEVIFKQIRNLLLPPAVKEHFHMYGKIKKFLTNFSGCIIDYTRRNYAHKVAREAFRMRG